MIKIARKLSPHIEFFNNQEIPKDFTYDIVTGVMVFQFIEKVEETFVELVKNLNRNGIIIFAVFDPQFVTSCLKLGLLFSDFDSIENPTVGYMISSGNIKIPVYIRNTSTYDDIMENLGFKKVLEVRPMFSEEFLSKYNPTDMATDTPEYLILGYKY